MSYLKPRQPQTELDDVAPGVNYNQGAFQEMNGFTIHTPTMKSLKELNNSNNHYTRKFLTKPKMRGGGIAGLRPPTPKVIIGGTPAHSTRNSVKDLEPEYYLRTPEDPRDQELEYETPAKDYPPQTQKRPLRTTSSVASLNLGLGAMGAQNPQNSRKMSEGTMKMVAVSTMCEKDKAIMASFGSPTNKGRGLVKGMSQTLSRRELGATMYRSAHLGTLINLREKVAYKSVKAQEFRKTNPYGTNAKFNNMLATLSLPKDATNKDVKTASKNTRARLVEVMKKQRNTSFLRSFGLPLVPKLIFSPTINTTKMERNHGSYIADNDAHSRMSNAGYNRPLDGRPFAH